MTTFNVFKTKYNDNEIDLEKSCRFYKEFATFFCILLKKGVCLTIYDLRYIIYIIWLLCKTIML